MAQACKNIGRELTSSPPSPLPSFPIKQRKSISPQEGKKSLKRTASISSVSPPTKKMSIPQSSSSSIIFSSIK